jgi:ketosteroid isomerase-like protein
MAVDGGAAALARRRAARLLAAGLMALGTVPAPAQTPAALAEATRQVTDAERAFARSMAERRHEDFIRHLAEQAVFFNGKDVLRGKAAVAAGWKPLFEAAAAPFSWEPDQVEVLDDGQLALSTGPVRNAQGRLIARFNSVWRLEAPGVWRIVFDKGQPADP